MANRRIRKKQEIWRRPLRKVSVSAAWAESHLDRMLQRLTRHREAYIIDLGGGRQVAMVPARWHGSLDRAEIKPL